MPTTIIDETASAIIDAPMALVRRQFGDLDHHARTHPHAAVTFEVLESGEETTLYRQRTRMGPVRVSQTLSLDHTDTGALVNTVVKGPFSGGTITFEMTPTTPESTTVMARLSATTVGIDAVVGRLSRGRLQRALATALNEDKVDIESGNYPSSSTPA